MPSGFFFAEDARPARARPRLASRKIRSPAPRATGGLFRPGFESSLRLLYGLKAVRLFVPDIVIFTLPPRPLATARSWPMMATSSCPTSVLVPKLQLGPCGLNQFRSIIARVISATCCCWRAIFDDFCPQNLVQRPLRTHVVEAFRPAVDAQLGRPQELELGRRRQQRRLFLGTGRRVARRLIGRLALLLGLLQGVDQLLERVFDLPLQALRVAARSCGP